MNDSVKENQQVVVIPYTIGYTVSSDQSAVHTIVVSAANIIEALNTADFRIRGVDSVYEIIFIKRKYPLQFGVKL